MEQGQGCKVGDQLAGAVLEPGSLEFALPYELVHCCGAREDLGGEFFVIAEQWRRVP